MHPRLTELFQYIDDQTLSLQAAYESVPIDRRAVRPGPDRWSPAEVLGHLVLVDQRFGMRFGSTLDAAPALRPESDASPILASIDVERVLDRSNKISAPEPAQPKDPHPERVLSEFADGRRALKTVIARGDGLALSEVTMPHPIFGALSLYEWIAFVGAHTARHAAQIREG